jgi:tetratricopeptide (TPR) repeat protein
MGATRKVTSTSSIVLNAWKADADYLQVLERTPAKDRLRRYRQLKKEYPNHPSFFVDVARLFYGEGDRGAALRILSNVVELRLEDPELLRLVAYQLLEMQERELAIETFKEILSIREEEPHSYRDLALAYNEAGNHSEAVRLLYEVVLGEWDDRFEGIRGVALNELNAIISSRKGALDCSAIDPVFIYPMPVDIRIVIGWNSNDSDMDLWVTDPKGEKCAYDHARTAIGGKISEDMTGGYGPEEYTLKAAVDGEYVVEANLYGDSRQTLGGPTTITAELFTGFGTPAQKRQVINFQVTTDKEVVRIGSLRFGK